MQRVEIKAAASRYDARRDDTASKVVVGADELQRFGDTSVLDAFKRVPGITVDAGQVKMHGLGSGYTQILLNGERAPAGFTLDSLSPDMIEKIEILRAASAEYSTQSIAGTINIILKKTVKAAEREWKIGAADSRQSFSPSTTLLLSDRLDKFSYSVVGNVFRYQYERSTPSVESGTDAQGKANLLRDTSQLDTGRSEGVNLTPRLNWTLENGDTLSSQSYMGVSQAGGSGNTDVATPLGAALDYDRVDSGFTSHSAYLHSDLNLVHKMEEGAKLDVKVGVNGSRNANDSRQLGASAEVLSLDRAIAADTAEKSLTSTGKYSTPLGDDHTLALGWEGGYTRRDDGRIQRDTPLPGNVPADSDGGYKAGVGRLAFFGQDEWNLGPLWSMYAGLRWEGVSTHSDGASFGGVRNRASVWSPVLQSLWKLPNKQDQVRLALTRTFKAPTLSSLTPRLIASTNNTQSAPDVQGNPNLKPELATGLDTSFDHYLNKDGALLSASASMRRIDNYTRQGLFFEDGRWLATPVNEGSATTGSVELEAKLPLKTLVDAAPAVDLHASVSRNWSQVDSVPGPDNRLDGQVPLSAVLGLDYKTPGGALRTGASFSFRNGGALRISETQGAYTAPRRDLDMYALWKIDPTYQLRLALNNLLGQDYASETSYTDASGTLLRNAIYPSSVQARATLEVKF
ncbi:MAG TPA: TonB-dependent receptor [Janthinobacterium sp.]|nr:TonB-dependent receptor [Janthinobacterium sp.]